MKGYDPGQGHWRNILVAAGLSERTLSGRQMPCPIQGCGGTDRFRFDDKDGRGTWFCNKSHGAGDGYKMLEYLTGESFLDAKRRLLREYPDGGPRKEPAGEKDYRKTLNALWSQAQAKHWALDQYFKGRGLPFTVMGAVIRYHPRCPYYDGAIRHTAPAMLARVFQNGKPITIHRTYLTDDVPSRRMLMPHSGTLCGAYIPLHGQPSSHRLGVAEGIETALAARQFTTERDPVWSCINAGQLEKFEPPAGVDVLSIYGDNDKTFTGQAAAFGLAKRLSNRVVQVMCRVLIPSVEGWDWNDVLHNQLDEKP